MWDAIQKNYGGDKNVLRDKSKGLRVKFNDMRMQEGETLSNIAQELKMLWMLLEELMVL